jgi:hypothetical protein
MWEGKGDGTDLVSYVSMIFSIIGGERLGTSVETSVLTV